jgi:hypothetical protein
MLLTPEDRNAKQKQAENKLKYDSLRTRGTKNVEYEMYDHAGNNWSHRGIVTDSNKKKTWKPYQENIRQIHYTGQLYWEQHLIPKVLHSTAGKHKYQGEKDCEGTK